MPRPAYESSRAEAPVLRTTLTLLAALALAGCSESTLAVAGDAPDASARDAAVARDAAPADAGPPDAAPTDAGPRVPADCGGRPCACDNGLDDDGDELIDGLDPECTGPFDDDEASFGTGSGTVARGECQDCFFDDDDDSTNDGCLYPSQCLFDELPTAGNSCNEDCSLSPQCMNTCMPRTPNGCDCFGCCEVTRMDRTVVTVLLGDGCSVKDVDDPALCPRCFQHATCRNPCGVCELCPGKKRRDLPMACRGRPEDDTPGFSCDDGEQVCDESRPCPRDYWCQLGCCLHIPQ